MVYLGLFILLLILELIYFRVASYFNIIDKPNERSSHSTITLRGGGIVFYFGAIAYFFSSGFLFPWFYLGLTLMTFISFLDDIYTLSNKIRLFIHFVAVLLVAYQLNMFGMEWYFLLVGFIIVVGVINAYNFMDGINGITASYSLAVCGLLLIVNKAVGFIPNDLLISVGLSLIVFSFFNFRNKAKCFAGDVGSVSIAYILIFAIGLLILKTGNFIYILFLSVYGIDTVWTIIQRLLRKENIFEAHRSHLYQYLANEAGINKLFVSASYALLQFGLGLLVIEIAADSSHIQLFFALIVLFSLSAIYLGLKGWIIKKYIK
ncbi:glycosyltransferase family 4 protein [Sphingobacterium thalpophilum]|uniref:MraY family glycosyltransferase n=1 Tax=Sphingobacterium thalpophilum TaxID=259 RepID=UPI0031DC0E6E